MGACGLSGRSCLGLCVGVPVPVCPFHNNSCEQRRNTMADLFALSGGQHCRNERLLYPDCASCVYGLLKPPACANFTPQAAAKREGLAREARRRYGPTAGFHFYPYLSSPFLQGRQALVGQWMAGRKPDPPKKILDVGPYESPIHRWLQHCPDAVVSIDPCAELATQSDKLPAFSGRLPCSGTRSRLQTSDVQTPSRFDLVIAPTLVGDFVASGQSSRYNFDAVVCLGCDGFHGPTVNQLRRLQQRAPSGRLTIYLEHPPSYAPSARLARSVLGLPGCNLTATAFLNFAPHFNSAPAGQPRPQYLRHSDERLVQAIDCYGP